MWLSVCRQGEGGKEPEKQGKEKKYPHRGERRKKTRRMGRDQRKEEARETIKGEEQRRREAEREGQEGCQRQSPRVGRGMKTRRHTLPHTYMNTRAFMCIHTGNYVYTCKSLVAPECSQPGYVGMRATWKIQLHVSPKSRLKPRDGQ